MSKFSFSGRPTLQLISRDEVERIHVASMKLLEEVGVIIHNERALKLLDN